MTDLPPLEARAPACLTPPPQDSGRRKTIGCKWGRALSTHISSPDSPGCAEAGGRAPPVSPAPAQPDQFVPVCHCPSPCRESTSGV